MEKGQANTRTSKTHGSMVDPTMDPTLVDFEGERAGRKRGRSPHTSALRPPRTKDGKHTNAVITFDEASRVYVH
jgi:hypothetical protein